MSDFEEGLSQLSMGSDEAHKEPLVEFSFRNLQAVNHAVMVKIALEHLNEVEKFYSNATMEIETVTGEVRDCTGCFMCDAGLHIPNAATYNPNVITKLRLV